MFFKNKYLIVGTSYAILLYVIFYLNQKINKDFNDTTE